MNVHPLSFSLIETPLFRMDSPLLEPVQTPSQHHFAWASFFPGRLVAWWGFICSCVLSNSLNGCWRGHRFRSVARRRRTSVNRVTTVHWRISPRSESCLETYRIFQYSWLFCVEHQQVKLLAEVGQNESAYGLLGSSHPSWPLWPVSHSSSIILYGPCVHTKLTSCQMHMMGYVVRMFRVLDCRSERNDLNCSGCCGTMLMILSFYPEFVAKTCPKDDCGMKASCLQQQKCLVMIDCHIPAPGTFGRGRVLLSGHRYPVTDIVSRSPVLTSENILIHSPGSLFKSGWAWFTWLSSVYEYVDLQDDRWALSSEPSVLVAWAISRPLWALRCIVGDGTGVVPPPMDRPKLHRDSLKLTNFEPSQLVEP